MPKVEAWICGCKEWNRIVRKRCQKCGRVRSPDSPTRLVELDDEPAVPEMALVDVWYCSACRKWTRATEKRCWVCGIVRPEDAQVGKQKMSERHSPRLAVPTQTRVRYDSATDCFTGTMSLLVKLAIRAIHELGWKLDNANENIGFVTFETAMSWGSWSGVSCSLNIEEISANQFRVTGSGKQNVRGGQILAINLGSEAQRTAAKAIKKMKELAR